MLLKKQKSLFKIVIFILLINQTKSDKTEDDDYEDKEVTNSYQTVGNYISEYLESIKIKPSNNLNNINSYKKKIQSSKYMLDIYHNNNTVNKNDTIIRFSPRDQNNKKAQKVKRMWFDIKNISDNYGILIEASLKLYRDNTFIIDDHNSYNFILNIWLKLKSEDNEPPKHQLVDSTHVPAKFYGWMSFNVTKCLKAWTDNPNENYGLYVNVTDEYNNYKDKITPERFGVIGFDGDLEYQPFVISYYKKTINGKINKTKSDEIKEDDDDDDDDDDEEYMTAESYLGGYLKRLGLNPEHSLNTTSLKKKQSASEYTLGILKEKKMVDQNVTIKIIPPIDHDGGKAKEVKTMWFNVEDITDYNGIIIEASLHLYRDNTFIINDKNDNNKYTSMIIDNTNYKFILSIWLKLKTEDNEQPKYQLVDSIRVPLNYYGWISFNVTKCLKAWTDDPTSNYGLFINVTDKKKNYKDSMTPEKFGVIGFNGESEYQPFIISFYKKTTSSKINKTKSNEIKYEEEEEDDEDDDEEEEEEYITVESYLTDFFKRMGFNPPANLNTTFEKEISASKFMLDIYNKNKNNDVDENDSLSKSDTIIAFSPLDDDGEKAKKVKRMWFDVDNVTDKNDILIEATLKLYIDNRFKINDGNKHKFNLSIWLRLKAEDTDQPKHQLVDSIHVLKNFYGWIDFNVTNCLEAWTDDPSENYGLYINVTDEYKNYNDKMTPEKFGVIGFDGDLEYQPFIISYYKNTINSRIQLHFEDDFEIYTRRRKRDVSSLSDLMSKINGTFLNSKSKKKKHCRLEKHHVDFAKIGYHNSIVEPPGYEFSVCRGECSFVMGTNVGITNHAVVQMLMSYHYPEVPKPCCTPSKLSPLSVLYMAKDSSLVLQNKLDMIADECGCH
ncbi:uncharacterized protein LOC122850686 [Aphidius gifuensis]|uniref:uncharacterized protein LOC122850686 n=1 Tax=Aphidius gifuensis TaxID=684658 RepID=UPI001CDD7D81|nr:uncharacterized protein LOC122850686 [Aphidius gifuensis]